MKAIRCPISSIVRGRALAAPIAPRHFMSTSTQDVQVSRLPGGVIVMSLETHSPVSNVAIVYNSGSRHESSSELGVTHCLRMAATQSSQKSTAFSVQKILQQIGSSLTCSTSREQMVYSVQCLRNSLSLSMEYLKQVAASPAFKPWELSDMQGRLKLDLELYNSSLNARLMDAIHKAAYRDSLGQSLYMNPNKVGAFTTKDLELFVNKHHVSHNAVVLGVGVDHSELTQVARKIQFRPGPAPTANKTKYHGGEVHIEAAGNLVHSAIVTEGVPLSSPDVLPAYVLQMVLSGSNSVQYGTHSVSKLHQAAQSVTNGQFLVNCQSLNYSDSGLFGVFAITDTFDVGKVLRAVRNAMSLAIKNGFTDAEVKRAKASVKSVLLAASGANDAALESLCSQALYCAQPLSPCQLAQQVDDVTTDAVNRVARKITSGKPSMAIVGNTVNSPYLDELS